MQPAEDEADALLSSDKYITLRLSLFNQLKKSQCGRRLCHSEKNFRTFGMA